MVPLWARCALLWSGLVPVVAFCSIWPCATRIANVACGRGRNCSAAGFWCLHSCRSAVEHGEMDRLLSAAIQQRAESLNLQVEMPQAVSRRACRLSRANSELRIAKAVVLGRGVGL